MTSDRLDTASRSIGHKPRLLVLIAAAALATVAGAGIAAAQLAPNLAGPPVIGVPKLTVDAVGCTVNRTCGSDRRRRADDGPAPGAAVSVVSGRNANFAPTPLGRPPRPP